MVFLADCSIQVLVDKGLHRVNIEDEIHDSLSRVGEDFGSEGLFEVAELGELK